MPEQKHSKSQDKSARQSRSGKGSRTQTSHSSSSSSRRPPRGNMGTGERSQKAKNVSAPASIGLVLPKSFFSMSGSAQQQTEIGGMHDSCRVVGCDLFATGVTAGSSTAAAGFGSTATYWVYLSPADISTRLTNLQELFQYYAIRKLQVCYVPSTGSSTAVNVALGIAQEAFTVINAVPTPTQQQLLELDPSVLTPVWNVASMTYTHTGTKLWDTSNPGSSSADNSRQLVIGATLGGTPVESTGYGSLWISFTIDFYKPSPVLNEPSELTDLAIRRICRARKCSKEAAARLLLDHLSSLSSSHTTTSSDCASDCKVSDEPVVVQEPLSSRKRDSDLTTGAAATRASSKERPALQRASTSASSSYFNFSSTAVPK
jgi:hypothetical protein